MNSFWSRTKAYQWYYNQYRQIEKEQGEKAAMEWWYETLDLRRREVQKELEEGAELTYDSSEWAQVIHRLGYQVTQPSSVSEPIFAPSDDHAIFELLAQVGCRMPKKESAA